MANATEGQKKVSPAEAAARAAARLNAASPATGGGGHHQRSSSVSSPASLGPSIPELLSLHRKPSRRGSMSSLSSISSAIASAAHRGGDDGGDKPSAQPVPDYHLHAVPTVLAHLGVTDPVSGLRALDTAARRSLLGNNRLTSAKPRSILSIILGQLFNPLVAILMAVFVIGVVTEEYIEAVVVILVILLNGGIGAFQEIKSEASLNAIRHLAQAQTAAVIRDGQQSVVDIGDLVVGDILELRQGQQVPADVRLLEAKELEVDEAILTGEAVPVLKEADRVLVAPADGTAIAVGDRINMAFRQTLVVSGYGRAVVVAVGARTEIGKITARLTAPRKIQRGTSKKSKAKGTPSKDGLAADGSGSGSGSGAAADGTAAAAAATSSGKGAQPIREEDEGAAGGASAADTSRSSDSAGADADDDAGDEERGASMIVPLSTSMEHLLYLLFATGLVFGVFIIWAFDWVFDSASLLYASATLVAILPEAAIVLITVTMALGARRMAQDNAIVRQMGALEQLGRVTDICSDKTGTLTQGKMRPSRLMLYLADDQSHPLRAFGVAGPALSRKGTFERLADPSAAAGEAISLDTDLDAAEAEALLSTLRVCALCASTRLSRVSGGQDDEDDDEGTNEGPADKLEGEGNPTEVALQELVHKACAARPDLEAQLWAAYTARGEWPFTSDAKRMSAGWQHRETQDSLCLVKGAPERLLPLCVNVDAVMRLRLERAVEQLAGQGLRVLAMAQRRDLDLSAQTLSDIKRDEVECDLHLVGLAALRDPPKKESFAALAECQRAGITVRMLTGDHKATAQAIARELGILSAETMAAAAPASKGSLPHGHHDEAVVAAAAAQLVMTGPQLDMMSDAALDALPELPVVVARASPESKVKIVEALHRRNRVVAMTGDGVNDSPALRTANVGVAMGITGSDVTKGVADLVLADDNFATIVSAVREGRRIFDSVSHFLLHLLSGNVAEAVTLMLSLAFVVDDAGKPVFVLSPLAILYLNTATGSPPAIGLALDKPAPDLMTRPPIRHGLYTREMICDFFAYGAVMGGLTLAAFCAVAWGDSDANFGVDCNEAGGENCEDVERARGAAFCTLNVLLLLHAYNCRHTRASAFSLPLRDNKVLYWSLFWGTLVSVPLLYIPWLNTKVFKHSGLTWEWGMVAGLCVVFQALAELYKAFKRALLPPLTHGGVNSGADADDEETGAASATKGGEAPATTTSTKGDEAPRRAAPATTTPTGSKRSGSVIISAV